MHTNEGSVYGICAPTHPINEHNNNGHNAHFVFVFGAIPVML